MAEHVWAEMANLVWRKGEVSFADLLGVWLPHFKLDHILLLFLLQPFFL